MWHTEAFGACGHREWCVKSPCGGERLSGFALSPSRLLHSTHGPLSFWDQDPQSMQVLRDKAQPCGHGFLGWGSRVTH